MQRKETDLRQALLDVEELKQQLKLKTTYAEEQQREKKEYKLKLEETERKMAHIADKLSAFSANSGMLAVFVWHQVLTSALEIRR